jgi:hypothetical protein
VAPTQTIKWTAVPNGLDSSGNNLQLSVLISPELSGGATGTLADFSDWQDWPSTLSTLAGDGLEWLVTFTSTFSQSIAVTLDTSGLNSALWTALFPTSVEYGPPEPIQDKFRNLAIASYPVQQVSGFLTDQYTQYAPDTVPTLDTLKSVYGPISDVLVGVTAQEQMEKLAKDRQARSKGGTVPHANDFSGASPAESFAAQAYYHLPPAGTLPVPEVPDIDFHKALTFIGQHGVLQRGLGLVFDILVPVKNVRLLTTTLNTNVFVTASLQLPTGAPPFSPGYTAVTPRTHCDASTTVFQPQAVSSDITSGQLTVGDPTSFLAHVIDFDGAGLRASNFATQIRLTEAPAAIHARYVASAVAPAPATPMAPPMIRSNGLTLTQVNRGVTFASSLARSFLLYDAVVDSNPVPDLTAEDLVRGYVLDVLDTANNTWRSTAEWLCTYQAGSQTVSGPTSPPFSESSTQAPPRVQNSPTDPNAQQANLSEVLLRYNGWSNALPRPGKVIQDADSQVTSPNPIPFSQLTITVTPPPGRLPPLRFGHTYQLRARIIDVCNNAPPVDTTASNSQQATTPMLYGRHEPIGSPDVYGQSVLRLAESLKRLVIRDIDGAGASSSRALAPQRCAEPFAEWHSMFDTGTGGAIDNSMATYNEIVNRESAQYPDLPANPATPPTQIVLSDPVPYLPDPIARGGVLTVTDGTLAGQTVPFDFSPATGGSWPDFRPVGVKLIPGSNPPQNAAQTVNFDATSRLITCKLTKGDTIAMNLSATCSQSDIALFALKDLFPSGTFDAGDAAAGKYWAITPFVTVELIYAVQQPLLTPEFPNFPTPPRAAGDTFAPLEGDLTWSPKSTSTIDLLASWGEPVDDPVNNLPVQGPGAPNANLRQTTNSPVATIPSATNSLASSGSQDYTATDRFSARHEFFDTKHRNVTYHAVATSQFTEFYPPGTNVTKSTAHPVLVDILSSARPDSPKIAYVVPIYDWQLTQPSAKTTVSERSPSALRVFIDRPWWSSGIDELLGVITWPGAEPGPIRLFPAGAQASAAKRTHRNLAIGGGGVNSAIPSDQAEYVTDWGADPVFGSSSLPSLHPRVSSFPNATESGFGLSIEENAGINVNVAGHPVLFDATRNLWYCDIAVNTGATYTPMIRLALARYQPNSVSGVELSRIVLADIMSLEPGRTATVVRKGPHHLSSVTLSGFSYSSAAGARKVAPGQAELIIERRESAIQDETLGWEQFGQPIAMTAGRGRGGLTTWVARNVKLPSKGSVRVCINQYEVLPTDNRRATRGFYTLPQRAREVRLLHQDLIPL